MSAQLPRRRVCLIATLLLLGACASPPPRDATISPARDRPKADMRPAPVAGNAHASVAGPPPQFIPVQDAVKQRDWITASLALETTDAPGDSHSELWVNYYRAHIAILRGDLDEAESHFSELEAQPLPAGLRNALTLQHLQRALLAGKNRTSADLLHTLYLAGGHAELDEAHCEELLWSVVQTLPPEQPRNAGWYSWWQLAQAANTARGSDAALAISGWLSSYPGHPSGFRAERLRAAALADENLRHPALLLPLSGPLGPAGEAVSNGLLAAYYQRDASRDLTLSILDNHRYSSISLAVDEALATGADGIIGPLDKLQVAEILALTRPDATPVLALNRPESPMEAGAGRLQLSLAPEDEAALIARRAYANGGRKALLIRPEGDWGDRMESALLKSWRPLGGRVMATAAYGKASSHSATLLSALQLDLSDARSDEIRRLFAQGVQSSGRRRRDIDVVFLLTKNADEARSLKPLLNYHYAGDLPVYAISTVDDGSAPSANRDLEGIRLPVMPWRLGPQPPGLTPSDTDGLSALHAMGLDAWQIFLRTHRISSGSGLGFAGHTAWLASNSDGVLTRELPMAEFDRGRLRPL